MSIQKTKISKLKINDLLAILVSVLIGLTVASAQAAPGAEEIARSSSGSPVIAIPGVSAAEIKAYATSKDKLPYSEYLEVSRPGADREKELRNRFQRAQKYWLSGDTDDARAEFRAMTELSLKADWRNPQREVLQAAYLRLAQTANSGTEKSEWIDSAVRYFADIEPNAALFPPPLIEEFQATKHRLLDGALEFEAWEVFPESRFVVIDGRKILTADRKSVALAPGVHRITALSDTHVAITEFLTVNQLRLFRASPSALIEGSCATARLKADLASVAQPELYSGKSCSASVASLQLKPQFLNNEFSQIKDEAPKAKSGSKTWLWVAGGLIISGAGYALARELSKDDKPETVRRSGF